LLDDGLKVFFDQNRGDEEKVPWPIWMENKIEVSDHVLLVCTDLYLKKVRQEVPANEGRGVCWEANLIYNWLYERKLNTTKFVSVLLSPADEPFIPGPLKGVNRFVLDSQAGYDRLFAFLTGQNRTLFPKQGATLQFIPTKTIQPLFGPAGKADLGATSKVRTEPRKVAQAPNLRLVLKTDPPPAPRQDIRGLDWYDECDAARFLGRDDDTNRLLAMLLSHPVIRLVGPSGIGKSSLIRAGLLPKIREFGWRACVIRPFENPAKQVVPQLTAGLLANPGKFSAPLDPAKFRAEVTPLLSVVGITRLVLLIDQFEDIVSPVTDPTALDSMRSFLREIWEQREASPYLRAVIVYRTDADARLGRLWQQVSGRPEGLPYLALQGMSRNATERIIGQTAREQGWTLETGAPQIARQLAQESQALGCSGEVFPVYLQIFLKHAQQSVDGRVTADSIAGLGGVAGLIGKYLEQTLARLKARGGDWQHCGAILEALSRSTGTKATESLSDLVRETGLGRAVLTEILPVLINERLVRPVGYETYEIQHDRLAAAVMESMKEGDREAKAACEFLAAKVPTFLRTKSPLAHEDLVYLYRQRHRLRLGESELQMILASLVDERSSPGQERGLSPGWFWFRDSTAADWLRRLTQVLAWSEGDDSPLLAFDLWHWQGKIPVEFVEPHFVALASHPSTCVRAMCAGAISRSGKKKYLPLLRKLALDKAWEVRTIAPLALAHFRQIDDLPRLLKLAKRPYAEVGVDESLEALENFGVKALPLWRKLARQKDSRLRFAALNGLATFGRVEDQPLLRELIQTTDLEDYLPRVMHPSLLRNPNVLLHLRELAKDDNLDTRVAAVRALLAFGRSRDLPLVRSLIAGQESEVRIEAVRLLPVFGKRKALPLLRELAKDHQPEVRIEAIKALAGFAQRNDLPLIRASTKDKDPKLRVEAVKALPAFGKAQALALVRGMVHDESSEVCLQALNTLIGLAELMDLPLLRKLVAEKDVEVRLLAVKPSARFAKGAALPLLRRMAEDEHPRVRLEAARALARFKKTEALSMLRELAITEKFGVAPEAARILASLCSRAEVEEFLDQHDQELEADVLVALDEALYMPKWLSEGDAGQRSTQKGKSGQKGSPIGVSGQ
jgi:HEAT repeat protein